MKRYCVVLVVGVFLAVAAGSAGQAHSPSQPGDSSSADTAERPAATQTKEKSIEELLSQLDNIKAQQEELEKARRELVEHLQKKLRQQKEHVDKLGISMGDEEDSRSAAPSPEPTTLRDKGSKPKNRLVALWDPRLRRGISSYGSNSQIPGIRGRIYVVSEAEVESDQGFQDGASVVVDLYRGEKRLETWEIGAAALKQSRRKDECGSSYHLTLPFLKKDLYSGQIRLMVRYKGPEGTVLETFSDLMTLESTTGPD